MRGIKHSLIIIICLVLNSCCEECYECVKCTSYNEKEEVVREVFDCSTEKTYLNGFVDGFKSKAKEQGNTAKCETTNVKCD